MASLALRAALERHFDASRLNELCRDALGVDPQDLGTDDPATLADALLRYCADRHLLAALADAICAYEPAARESLADERAAGSSEPPLDPDTHWGPFLIQEHLGRGPTGDCYRAVHGTDEVRLKVLHSAINASALQRVLVHARLLNRWTTRGFPKNVQAGTVEGRSFIASQWQPSRTLQQVLLQDGPLPPPTAIRLACALLDTLQQLHEAGTAAGSLKASNVLIASLDEDATPTLLDLGSNLLLGKPSNLSDDLTSLASLLYEMLSAASSAAATKASVAVPPSAAGAAQFVAPELDTVILNLLNGRPQASTAVELREQLQNVTLSGTSDDAAIEQLLELSEAAASRSEKAELLHKIGNIYEKSRHDDDQALVAYIQALCEDPRPRFIASIDRVAGQNPERWHDVLAAAGEAVSILDPSERKVLLLQMGNWSLRLQQLDTAKSAFSAVLDLEPSNEQAGKALEQMFKDAQQWPELRGLLLRRAAEEPDPSRAIELRLAAAEIAELRLQDPVSASQEYARVLEQVPRHDRAFQALNRHYEKERDYSSLKELLRKRADTSSGAEAAALHLRVAQLCQTQLGDASQARTHFELALQHDPTSQDAWLGLERVLVEQKQIQPLLELLTRRLSVAETPRERVDLLLRCAKLYEEELLQPQRAAESLSQVLVIDPLHAHAKEALIVNHLRTAEQRRAAGEIEQAAELFRQVLDLDAENLAALKGLSSIELKRGTWDGAVALLEKQVALTPDDETKASLLVEIGALKYQQLHDLVGARSATERALQIKPTLVGALTQAGDIAYDQDRLRDATQHYQQAIAQLHNLPTEVATRVLRRQVDSLDRLGSPSTAVDLLDPLLELAPDDPAVLSIAARLLFAHGTPAKAVDVHERLLREHRDAVPSDELALLTLHLGQSHQRTGNPSAALVHLEEAADLSPSTKEPIEALVLAYSELDDWNGVLKCKQRLLDLSDGAARAELLAEMAIITSDKLSDKPTAIRSLVAALEDKPDDRKLLTRLMALYSDGKDWSKLVEVISRLEALAENPEQKTKYLMTSAMVCQRELSDNERALAFYDRVLTLDPNHTKAADESLSLARALGKLDTVERLLSERLQRAQQTNSHGDLLAVFLQLGSLYKDDLHRSEAAVDAFEAAQTLDPQNDACLKALDELYGVDLDRYRDKAILLHTSQLHHNPFTPEPYQQLRRLYTGLRRADPAWCLCRTLNALSLSSPEEDQFYDRLRSEEAVAMENPLAPEDWQLLMHADADPLVTAIFSVIEPVVLATRATPITSLGYDPEAALDPAASEDPALQVLPYVAGALDSALPQIFANPSLAEPMTLLATDPPAVVLGAPFLEPSAPTQSLVFMAGQTLCGLLPGLRLRQFLSSGTGFKSWLLAAIRLNAPTFAIPTELVGPVGEAHAALRELLPPQARDELAHLIAKLLSDPGALDVKKWQIAVDCSADRAGFLLANDLRTAIDAIRGPTTELTSAQAARIKELVLFSVDEHYFTLRERLGVAIG